MRNKSPPIQALYDLCKKTFSSSSGLPPPAVQAIQKLTPLLDTIGPSDVGLKETIAEDDQGYGFFGFNQLNRAARWAQPITYVDVSETANFTMCIFCLPTSSVIPLHDHPGMTVLSKMLYGSMHIKSYDWVEPAIIRNISGSPVRLAKLVEDKVLTAPCETASLRPKHGGNLHCFTAVTPCAVLDILAPPYLEAAGRKCTYYHDYPYSSIPRNVAEKQDVKEEEYAWLKAIDTPSDLYMRSGQYTGPPIQN